MAPRTPIASAALALLLVSGASAAPEGKADKPKARAGKVVRVERVRGAKRVVPRLLALQSQTRAMAYVTPPQLGAEVVILDYEGVAGRGTVSAIEANQQPCQDYVFNVDLEIDGWNHPFAYGFGIVGVPVTDDARALQWPYGAPTPSGRAQESVWVAVDRDGDGGEDMLVTHYACADTEPPGPSSAVSTAPYCFDIYLRDSGEEWQRAAHDVAYQCR